MNFHSIQIKFAIGVALPLVEELRALAASELKGKNASSLDASDLTKLVRLFESDFDRVGRVTLSDSNDCESVLRACSRLRLTLRAGPLSAFTAHELEHEEFNVNTDAVTAENTHVMLYLFLATIQQTLLDHRLPATRFDASHLRMRISKFFASIFQPQRNAEAGFAPPLVTPFAADAPTHAVWVLNDPVNLMTYVTAVFEDRIHLPTGDAERFTREVHEDQQSKVWHGPRHEAGELAASLRTWHLTAEVRPFNPN